MRASTTLDNSQQQKQQSNLQQSRYDLSINGVPGAIKTQSVFWTPNPQAIHQNMMSIPINNFQFH